MTVHQHLVYEFDISSLQLLINIFLNLTFYSLDWVLMLLRIQISFKQYLFIFVII